MNYDPLIKDLELKVEEVSEKYEKLKGELQEYHDHEINDHAQRSMKELERLVRDIHDQYAQVHEKETLNDQKLSKVEKTIYSIIRSFNRAYASTASNFKSY